MIAPRVNVCSFLIPAVNLGRLTKDVMTKLKTALTFVLDRYIRNPVIWRDHVLSDHS
jgi:hypothetical protein